MIYLKIKNNKEGETVVAEQTKDVENIKKEEEVKESVETKGTEASQDVDTSKEEKQDNKKEDKKAVNKESSKEAKTSKLKKEKKKDKRDVQIEELKDRLVRNMAEFDNFRKRTEKEKSAMFEIGAKSIVEKILPVVDNFERALDSASDEEKETPFVQGIDKIYKHMITSLEEAGVKPIEAVGKEFDPEFHNAVMHEDDDSMGENIVSEELQKGYMYKESVVRHSMVKVVN